MSRQIAASDIPVTGTTGAILAVGSSGTPVDGTTLNTVQFKGISGSKIIAYGAGAGSWLSPVRFFLAICVASYPARRTAVNCRSKFALSDGAS